MVQYKKTVDISTSEVYHVAKITDKLVCNIFQNGAIIYTSVYCEKIGLIEATEKEFEEFKNMAIKKLQSL